MKKTLAEAVKGMQVKSWEVREHSNGKRVVVLRGERLVGVGYQPAVLDVRGAVLLELRQPREVRDLPLRELQLL